MTRRRLIAALLVVGLQAQPMGAARSGPSENGFASDGVEWVGRVSVAAPTAALEHRNYLYVTNERELRVFDVSDPREPLQVGQPLTFDATPFFNVNLISADGDLLFIAHTFTWNDPIYLRPRRMQTAGASRPSSISRSRRDR